jgi:hypothetical protein
MKKPLKPDKNNGLFQERHPILYKAFYLVLTSGIIAMSVWLEVRNFTPWLSAQNGETLVSFPRGSLVSLAVPCFLVILIGTLAKDTRFKRIYQFAVAQLVWTAALGFALIPLSIFVVSAVQSYLMTDWGYSACKLYIGDQRYGTMWAKIPSECPRDYISNTRIKKLPAK